MKKISLLKLFFIFVKVGAILLGGGYVILPILMSEIVEKRKLITEEELLDFFAISQSLPGIIAANISMFVGYKLRSFLGAVVSMLGVIFVPFLCIVLLASGLSLLTSNNYIQSIFWGVGVAVIALIILTVREMWQKSHKDTFFYLIFLLSLIVLLVFKLSPVKTILIFVLFGVLYKTLIRLKEVR